MANEERTVYTFEPGSGFTRLADDSQKDKTPVISREPQPDPEPDPQPQPPKPDPQPTPDPEPQPDPQPDPEPQPDPQPTPDDDPQPDPQPDPTPGDDPQPDDDPTPDPDDPTNDPQPDPDPQPLPQTDDFFVVAAARLKSQGVLPEDFELEENMDEDQADQAIYNAYIENLKPQANKELLDEFQREMQKKGWTQETLEYASLLQNGVRPEEISQIQDYKTLASVDVGKMSEDDKIAYARQMYEDRGWKEKEIKRAIDSADVDGELDSLASEAETYFKKRESQVSNEKKQLAEQNLRQKEQLMQYQQSVLAHIFNNKELGGEVFSDEQLDEFEDALYNKTIPVQLGNQVYQVSPYEQFEAMLNQDFSMKLWAFKKWMFREQEAEQYKAQAQKEAEEARVMKWGKRTKKVDKSNTKGDPNNKSGSGLISGKPPIQASSEDGFTYIMEGGKLTKVPRQ